MKVPILLPNIFNYPFTYESSHLNLKIGDKIMIMSSSGIQTIIGDLPKQQAFIVSSIFEAKYYRNYLDDIQDDKLRNALVGSGIRVYTDSGPDEGNGRQYVIKDGSVTGWEEENGKYVINKDAFYSKDKDPTEKDDMSKKDKLSLRPKMDETMKRYVDWMKK